MLNVKKFLTGLNIEPTSTSTVNSGGDMEVLSSTGKLNYYNASASSASQVVTENHPSQGTSRLTNKDFDTTTTEFVDSTSTTKALGFDTSGAQTTTKTTIASVQTANRTLTLPDVTDTLAGISATQTLTNKTIDGNNNTLLNIPSSATNATPSNTPSTIVSRDSSGNFAAGTITANLTGNASGTASNVTGTVAIANGGTGQVTAAAAFNALAPATSKGGLIAASGTNTYANLPVGTDNQVLIASSTAADGVSWTTLQQGSKNYITYNNFENNATTGWSLGTVGTLTNGLPTGTPTFGSGASGSLSFTTISSNPLAGSYSGSLISSAATTAGNMLASQAYTIDNEDQAKVLGIRFYYNCPVNGGANFSGTSSNSLAWGIWDVTNSVWLSSAGNFNIIQSTGSGFCSGTCQTNITTKNIRLVLYFPTATTGATTFNLDDFYVGPQIAAIGSAMSDWVPYTPTFTGFGTVTNIDFYSRRTGDSLEIHGLFTAGTPTSTIAQITLGYNGANSNVNYDSLKVTLEQIVGNAVTSYTNINFYSWSVLIPDVSGNQNYLTFGVQTNTTAASVPAQGSNMIGAGSQFSFHACVPIAGWSSNTVVSSDTDTRVIAMQVMQSTPTCTISGSPSLVKFTTSPLADSSGSFSTSTGGYTCPVTGFYRADFNICVQGTFALNQSIYLGVAKNSTSSFNYNTNVIAGGAQSTLIGTISGTIFCNAGDILYPLLGGSGTGMSISSNATANYFNVDRLSGPATITATESVNARYALSGTVTLGGSQVQIPWDTKFYDSHNAFNSGTYTCPVSGKYEITSKINSGTFSGVAGSLVLYLYHNGSVYTELNRYTATNGQSSTWQMAGTDSISCLAGDTISVYGLDGNHSDSWGGNTAQNYITIKRIGN